MLIQVILILFIVFAVSKVALRYKDRVISLQEFILWTVFWLMVGFVVIFPESTAWVANFVGIGRGVDLVVYLSILMLFYLVFRVLVRLDKVEKDITKIIRQKAIVDHKNKQNEYKRD